MPNHIHGAIEVLDPKRVFVETRHGASQTLGANRTIFETPNRASLQKYHNLTKRFPETVSNDFYVAISKKSNQIIPNIIRSFKSAVKNTCNDRGLNLIWQPRFYDHVVRNEVSLTLIENYIRDNPLNWPKDRNNPLNQPHS